MDLRHFGIPFVVYPQGNARGYPASYYDDTLPREFAELNPSESQGRARTSSSRHQPRSSPKTSSDAKHCSDGNNHNQQPDLFAAPATLIRATPANHARAVSMEYTMEQLESHMKDARDFYATYVQEYDERALGVNLFASQRSRDTLWQNFLDKKFESLYEKVKFTSMLDKIVRDIQEIKMIATVGGVHKTVDSERNARKARKLSAIGEELTKLCSRAATEKHACDDLVEELDDAIQVILAKNTSHHNSPIMSNANNSAAYGNYGQDSQGNTGYNNQQGSDDNAPQQGSWDAS